MYRYWIDYYTNILSVITQTEHWTQIHNFPRNFAMKQMPIAKSSHALAHADEFWNLRRWMDNVERFYFAYVVFGVNNFTSAYRIIYFINSNSNKFVACCIIIRNVKLCMNARAAYFQHTHTQTISYFVFSKVLKGWQLVWNMLVRANRCA